MIPQEAIQRLDEMQIVFAEIADVIRKLIAWEPDPPQHSGDCTIYASLVNEMPTDGICTCGYGWSIVRREGGDWREMLSDERRKHEASKASTAHVEQAGALRDEWSRGNFGRVPDAD